MLYIDLQQEPEAADYVAVFAVEQRGGSFEYFTGCSQLFAKLVHQRPGIARTGLSFYRAVLEEEFDRLP